MQDIITIHQVSKRYGEKNVLNNISFSIEKGKIYGFIGPSGSGKTTLIKLIIGMEQSDNGTIHLLNQKMPNLSILQQIGYMAQSDALYMTLTGLENLQFFGALYQLKAKELQERIRYVANLVNLTADLNKKVATYSGGMKRRLSLAISLIQDPEILILDEPTVGIDPELRMSIWKELMRLKEREGKTIIVTTHVMSEAEKCDSVSLVRDGSILVKGTPTELKHRFSVSSLEEVFLYAGRVEQ